MIEVFQWPALLPSVLHRGIRESVPLLLAASGEVVVERAGLVNIGIEGAMLSGALTAAVVGWANGSAWIGVAAAAGVGVLIGLLFAGWTVWGGRDQIVTGLAINLLALGMTGVLIERLDRGAAANGVTIVAPRLAPVVTADLQSAPARHVLLHHDPMVFATLLIVIMTAVFLRFTRPGLSLSAVGENAEAADTAGIRVSAVRTTAAMFGCTLAAIGGAYLTVAISDRFQEGMTNGRGFVALALVIFGRWSPVRIALAALFFGLLDALQTSMQPYLGSAVHVLYPALLALPYVLTLIALAGLIGRAHPPAWDPLESTCRHASLSIL